MKAKESWKRSVFSLVVALTLVALYGCSGATSNDAGSTTNEAPSNNADVETVDGTDTEGGDILYGTDRAQIEDALSKYQMTFGSMDKGELDAAYTLTIDGESYALPFRFGELIDNGWSTDVETWESTGSYYKMPDELPKQDEYVKVSVFKGTEILDVLVTPANGANTLEDCAVFSLTVSNSETDAKLPHIVLPSGIELGRSVHDVIQAYGKPTAPGISLDSGEEADRWRLSTCVYSDTQVKIDAAKEQQEEERIEEHEKKVENGELDILATPVQATTVPFGGKYLDYDEIELRLDRDGLVNEITVFNSYF